MKFKIELEFDNEVDKKEVTKLVSNTLADRYGYVKASTYLDSFWRPIRKMFVAESRRF